MSTPLALIRTDQWPLGSKPEMDALTQEDALRESQLVEAFLDTTARRVGLLFDLRQALQLRKANTALLVFAGVREIAWLASPRSTNRTAWNVVSSLPDHSNGMISLALSFVPDAEAKVVAQRAAFYVGDVPDLPAAPPDFGNDSEEAIASGLPTMESPFEPVHASVLGR